MGSTQSLSHFYQVIVARLLSAWRRRRSTDKIARAALIVVNFFNRQQQFACMWKGSNGVWIVVRKSLLDQDPWLQPQPPQL